MQRVFPIFSEFFLQFTYQRLALFSWCLLIIVTSWFWFLLVLISTFGSIPFCTYFHKLFSFFLNFCDLLLIFWFCLRVTFFITWSFSTLRLFPSWFVVLLRKLYDFFACFRFFFVFLHGWQRFKILWFFFIPWSVCTEGFFLFFIN